MSPLVIRLFGPPSVWVAGQPLRPLRTRKGLYLLILLALRANRPVERDWLASQLWPDATGEHALANLRRSLTDLREALGPEEGRLQSPNKRTLLLDISGADIDFLRFDANPENHLELGSATLLESVTEEWATQERRPREEAYLNARLKLAREAEHRRDFVGATRHYQALIDRAPENEVAWRGLMSSLAGSGDHNAALAAYHQLDARLRREFSATPDAETTTLFRTLRQQTREIVVRPVQVTKEQVAALGWLPVPGTCFVGRRHDIEAVSSLLATNRCATISGPGGMGKTRLALSVGEEISPLFADGVWFVDLSGLSDTAQLPTRIAAVLSPNLPATVPLRQQIASRHLLLILDNCENLSEACASLAADLLTHCPYLRILTTSHAPLGIPTGEALYPLAALPPEETLQLFIERARAVRADFDLDRESEAAQRLCAGLDGIPLAVELAAARLNVLSAGEIAARLGERFALLAQTRPGGILRHRSLENALSWTWSLLGDEDRERLRLLAVLRGSWCLATASYLLAEPPLSDLATLDLLAPLIDRALVVRECGGETRYRLLDTVRQFASEQATAEERTTALQRLTQWSLVVANTDDNDQIAWFHRADLEWPHLSAAITYCVDSPEKASDGVRLLVRLTTFCIARHYTAERWGQIHRILAHLPQESRAWRDGLYQAARYAMVSGDIATARQHFQEFIRLWRETFAADPNPYHHYEIAGGLSGLAQLEMRERNDQIALPLLEEAMGIFKEIGLEEWEGDIRCRIGTILARCGAPEEGYSQLSVGISLSRLVNNRMGLACNLPALAALEAQRGDYDTAKHLYREALELQVGFGYPWLQAESARALGDLLQKEELWDEAREQFQLSAALWNRLGDTMAAKDALTRLSSLPTSAASASSGTNTRLP